MTTFYLCRHALHSFGEGKIAGRTPGVRLSEGGERQLPGLADRLADLPITAIYTSPIERCQQTAGFVGDRLGLSPRVNEALTELDFGDWQGEAIEELKPDETWKMFNAYRSGTRAPGGELMPEVQLRIVRAMLELSEAHQEESIAIFSHADVIKAATAYFLGVPIDLFQRIEISPASTTTIALAPYGPWVLGINATGALPRPA